MTRLETERVPDDLPRLKRNVLYRLKNIRS